MGAKHNCTECLRLLLSHGGQANPAEGRTSMMPVSAAVFGSSAEALQILLDNGANPNSWMDAQQCGIIHQAAMSRNSSCLKFLLEYGADANLPDSCDCTALHYAAALGSCMET